MVRKRFKDAIRQQVIETLVQEAFKQVMEREKQQAVLCQQDVAPFESAKVVPIHEPLAETDQLDEQRRGQRQLP